MKLESEEYASRRRKAGSQAHWVHVWFVDERYLDVEVASTTARQWLGSCPALLLHVVSRKVIPLQPTATQLCYLIP